MNSDKTQGYAVVALFLLVAAYAANNARKVRVDVHMDTENNVLCYVTRKNMQCFPYVDQGTHLELPQTQPGLAL